MSCQMISVWDSPFLVGLQHHVYWPSEFLTRTSSIPSSEIKNGSYSPEEKCLSEPSLSDSQTWHKSETQ